MLKRIISNNAKIKFDALKMKILSKFEVIKIKFDAIEIKLDAVQINFDASILKFDAIEIDLTHRK